MPKFRIHFRQEEKSSRTPINEFFWIVEGIDEEDAKKNLTKDLAYWASINVQNRADHNAKVPGLPPQVPIVWQGVKTIVYSVKKVRDNASN
jgi:hypothetical protein